MRTELAQKEEERAALQDKHIEYVHTQHDKHMEEIKALTVEKNTEIKILMEEQAQTIGAQVGLQHVKDFLETRIVELKKQLEERDHNYTQLQNLLAALASEVVATKGSAQSAADKTPTPPPNNIPNNIEIPDFFNEDIATTQSTKPSQNTPYVDNTQQTTTSNNNTNDTTESSSASHVIDQLVDTVVDTTPSASPEITSSTTQQ